ncbi:hypothetical protein [Streptomyces sp. NBC_00096]|uniref:hypothetical protein n=1 Tax=Streptomyces sp. NBC_00096 TaxID=2975650 RepID=UPI00324C7011
MKPAFAGSEQSRWVCTPDAAGVAGVVVAEAVDGAAAASKPPDIRAATATRLLTRLMDFDCNELPSMGGRITAAWDEVP